MDVLSIQALGAYPLTEMDRKGVSGDDGSLPWGAGLGFEQSLFAMLVPSGVQLPTANLLNGLPQTAESMESANAAAFPLLKAPSKVTSGVPSPALSLMKSSVSSEVEANADSRMEWQSPAQDAKVDLLISKDGKPVQLNPESAKTAQLQSVSLNPVSHASQLQASSAKNSDISQKIDMDVISEEELGNELEPLVNMQKDLRIKGEALSELKINPLKEQSINRSLGLKNLADTLYVQSHLSSETQFSMPELKAEIGSEGLQPHVVRDNLMQDMQSFITRIVETNEGGSVSLKLRPGNMGEVQVKVEVNSESVRIHMETESASAEHLLKSQSGELKQQLQNVGLRVEDIQVSSQRFSDSSMDQKGGQGSERDAQHSAHQHKKDERNSENPFSFDESGLDEIQEA